MSKPIDAVAQAIDLLRRERSVHAAAIEVLDEVIRSLADLVDTFPSPAFSKRAAVAGPVTHDYIDRGDPTPDVAPEPEPTIQAPPATPIAEPAPDLAPQEPAGSTAKALWAHASGGRAPAQVTVQAPTPKVEKPAGESKPAEDLARGPHDFTGRALADQRTAPRGSLISCEECDADFVKDRVTARFHTKACMKAWHASHRAEAARPVVLTKAAPPAPSPAPPVAEPGPPPAPTAAGGWPPAKVTAAPPPADGYPCDECDHPPFAYAARLAHHVAVAHSAAQPASKALRDAPTSTTTAKVGESRSEYEARLRAVGEEAMAL